MADVPDPTRIPLTEAARRLGVRYRRALDLMLEGKLGESVKDGSRWFLTVPGVQRAIEQRKRKAARA